MSQNITKTQEYRQCFQLLSFQSREELSTKVRKVRDLIINNGNVANLSKEVADIIVDKLERFVDKLYNLDGEEEEEEVGNNDNISELMGRLQLKEVFFYLI